mmetsp:Transcript_27862/g.86778  ORF Transcript_27862/g.86778 Transcript_27862/m.86778 type:complete len:124 (-) Transcript_27862:1196-1567(-)
MSKASSSDHVAPMTIPRNKVRSLSPASLEIGRVQATCARCLSSLEEKTTCLVGAPGVQEPNSKCAGHVALAPQGPARAAQAHPGQARVHQPLGIQHSSVLLGDATVRRRGAYEPNPAPDRKQH